MVFRNFKILQSNPETAPISPNPPFVSLKRVIACVANVSVIFQSRESFDNFAARNGNEWKKMERGGGGKGMKEMLASKGRHLQNASESTNDFHSHSLKHIFDYRKWSNKRPAFNKRPASNRPPPLWIEFWVKRPSLLNAPYLILDKEKLNYCTTYTRILR